MKEHAKGKEFAHLLEGKEFYPIVIDSANVVASMPPIINSQTTGKVGEETKDIFLECTGYNWETINIALKVMCMALADRGAEIESCEIHLPKFSAKPAASAYPKESIQHTPEFGVKKKTINPDYVRRLTGMDWTNKEIVELLERARYECKLKGKKIELLYPDFRNEILHEVDVIEDILIAYGFNKIPALEIKMATTGSERPEVLQQDIAREICAGLGLQEILQFTMTSKETQETKMLLQKEEFVELANPVSLNYTIFRKSLVPEMLSFLAKNKTVQMPHHLFEVGKVLDLDATQENSVKERVMICAGFEKNETNFTEIK
ncbi:MAG: phenylalanine--tRNA ligase subunit beta, partial [Candidatus Diapherotrites archaeon]|nr:phenylalanine--tRNA ligase subunit beta [Candidatus Diapherotrites archaeon]